MLEVTNPPTKPVLAIHAGSVRRQAKLEVNQPFVIPHPGSQTGPVEVSLFQQLASQVLPNDSTPEVFCNIPVRKLDGSSSEVKLCVRRGEAANAGKQQQKSADSMGVTRDYLDHHQLQQRIQSLIQDVLREQPENPYKYMLEQLRKTKGGNQTDAQEPPAAKPAAAPEENVAPLVPRPPDMPKPQGKGGRNSNAPKGARLSFGGMEVMPPEVIDKAEAMVAARFSVTSLLRMPQCQAAAVQSVRHSARKDAAKSMAMSVLDSVKTDITKMMTEPLDSTTKKSMVRASLSCIYPSAAKLLSPEYHKAYTSWARYVAYRGAGHIITGEERRAQGLDPEKRRGSALPTPIVFLASEGGAAWGSWLGGGK